jgi:hypothetical protein
MRGNAPVWVFALVFMSVVFLVVVLRYVASIFRGGTYEKMCKGDDNASVTILLSDARAPRKLNLADFVLDVRSREFFQKQEHCLLSTI